MLNSLIASVNMLDFAHANINWQQNRCDKCSLTMKRRDKVPPLLTDGTEAKLKDYDTLVSQHDV